MQDGNSMDSAKVCPNLYGDADGPAGEAAATCIPGCYLPAQQCPEVLRKRTWDTSPYAHGCSYPPTDLKGALTANEWLRDTALRQRRVDGVVFMPH